MDTNNSESTSWEKGTSIIKNVLILSLFVVGIFLEWETKKDIVSSIIILLIYFVVIVSITTALNGVLFLFKQNEELKEQLIKREVKKEK